MFFYSHYRNNTSEFILSEMYRKGVLLMDSKKQFNLFLFLVLISFMTLFATGTAFACNGGGGGGGGGGSDSGGGGSVGDDVIATDTKFNVEATAEEELVFENPYSESAEATPTTIEIDGNAPTEQDRAATIRNITAVVESLPYAGGIAVSVATSGWSVPASALAGGLYAYGTSRLSGSNEDDSRRSGVNSTLAGFAPGGPAGQAVAGEVLSEMQDKTPNYSAPTAGPNRGAELNSNTGQVTQR
jgi:hypothetical protein